MQTVKQVILINIHLLPVLFKIYTALHVSQFPSESLVTVAVFQDFFPPALLEQWLNAKVMFLPAPEVVFGSES